MKKLYLILFFVALIQNCFSQDTIIYNDGSFRQVKITTIDTLNRTLHYVRKNTNHAISMEEIIAYKFNESWYSKEDASGQFSVSKNALYKFKPNFFTRPAKYTYNQYSISATYSPSYSSFGPLFMRNLFATQFCHNATIRIEPEYLLHPKISIKIPIVIGLGIESAPYQVVNYELPEYYYNKTYFHFSDYTYSGELELYDRNPQWQSISFTGYTPVHKNELLYQIGITPKFYPFGQTRNAFFISQSINWGRGNFNSVDYYYDYDTIQTSGNYTYWKQLSETAVVNKSWFNYFRFETLVGINFNISSSLCFSLESGFSTTMRNNSKIEDRVFLKTPGEDYQLIYSGVYQTNPSKEVINPDYSYNSSWNLGSSTAAKFINRIHLVYKFGGKRIDKKVKPN
jgi:hypothetical protein